MPNYEFLCEKCGTKKDVYLAMTKRDTPQKCDSSHIMTRLIGKGSGFNLKGNGFYKPGWNGDKE